MAVRPGTWGLLGSLSLHGMLAVLAINLGIQEGMVRMGRPSPRMAGGGWGGASVDGERQAFPYDRPIDAPMPDVGGLMRSADAATNRLNRQQKSDALRNKAGLLKQFPAAHVDQAAGVVEYFYGVDESRHDIRRSFDSRGDTVYIFTFVDKDGRTLTGEVPKSQMTSDDLMAYRIHELARKNEGLRRLIQAATKIHEARNGDKE
ncbi:MAG: hypothetical protein BWX88_00757 [Planctomycetes bacterium ADurb.Bin126]|nr:MAG: hypothetical protein BWX88_00757 [Planctomycetes bacterium ADurb.Bin126]